MKKAILIILSISFAFALNAQKLTKVVVKKFENGKPELVNYYAGAKTAENLRKQESLNFDGKVVLEKNFMNTLLHGPYKEFKEFDGAPVKEMNYKEGKLDGPQFIYFSDGRVKFSLNYVGGAMDGAQKEYFFKEDTIKAEHNYSGGIFHGMQRKWNPDGTKAYHFNFVAGKPDGIQRAWNNGRMTEEKWTQGQLEDVVEEWSAIQAKEVGIYTFTNEGDSLDIKWGKKLEKGIRYFDSGSIKAIQEPGDPPTLTEYHPNGKVKGKGTGTFKAKEGKWEFFHQNGEKMTAGEFKNGKKMGVFQHWDEKGRLVEEEVWNADGTQRQSWTVMSYHWNDKKAYEGSLTHDGWKTGIWKYWYELGERKIEENWKTTCGGGSDRPVLEEYTEWTKSGKVVREGNEREQIEYAYHENGERKTLTTLLFAERDPCEMDQPERYVGNGIFEKKVTSPGYFKSVNTLVINLTEAGDSITVDRYNREGKRDGYQDGWYPKGGKKRYSIHFLEGRVQGTVKEWYPDGTLKMDCKYASSVGGPYKLTEGIFYNEKGKDYEWTAADGKDKKKSILEIETGAYFFEFMKMNPNE